MMIIWLFILFSTIETYSKMKYITKDYVTTYIDFYKKKYIIDVALILFCIIISYVALE